MLSCVVKTTNCGSSSHREMMTARACRLASAMHANASSDCSKSFLGDASVNSKILKPTGTAINIMGREFRVATVPGEEALMAASVELVNRRMKEVQASGRVVGGERVAMLAALNIAHELLASRAGKGVDLADIQRRIAAMERDVDQALNVQQTLL
jgi:cell division protein ZapA